MGKYILDFTVFVTQRMPQVLRQTRHIGWLLALLTPLRNLHNRFIQASNAFLKQAKITPQRRILRGALNDAFDPMDRRIEITDGGTSAFLYLFNTVENRPVYLPQYLQGTSATSFIVQIPVVLLPQTTDIRQFVNRYKLPVLQFSIVAI